MPYNLEYDFAVIQERTSALDSLEQDASRMQQYWGVATTELWLLLLLLLLLLLWITKISIVDEKGIYLDLYEYDIVFTF